MQTFLPLPTYAESASVLDDKRLHNQANECKVILNTLLGKYKKGWKNHPAVKMWKGHEASLCRYAIQICLEYIKRRAAKVGDNYRYNNLYYFQSMQAKLPPCEDPPWLGNKKLHASHRSNLLRKDPEWYGKFRWAEKPNLPYFWISDI